MFLTYRGRSGWKGSDSLGIVEGMHSGLSTFISTVRIVLFFLYIGWKMRVRDFYFFPLSLIAYSQCSILSWIWGFNLPKNLGGQTFSSELILERIYVNCTPYMSLHCGWSFFFFFCLLISHITFPIYNMWSRPKAVLASRRGAWVVLSFLRISTRFWFFVGKLTLT